VYIMHINKLFRQTSQLKPNIFHKFYHFPNARNGFIRSVPLFRILYRPHRNGLPVRQHFYISYHRIGHSEQLCVRARPATRKHSEAVTRGDNIEGME